MTTNAAVIFMNPGSMPPPAGYTQAVEVKNSRMLYISGQVALDRYGNLVGEGDLAAQTEQVFNNIKAALEAAGASFADVVKLTYFVTDIGQIQIVRDIRDRYVNTANPPASSAVEVRKLVREQFLIEIEAIAAVAP